MTFNNHKLTKTGEEVRTINNNKVLEIKFKDEQGNKFAGLCKATEENLNFSQTFKVGTLNGEARENTFSNKYGTFTTYNLTSNTMREFGFDVQSHYEALLAQIKE